MKKLSLLLPVVTLLALGACNRAPVTDHAEIDPSKSSFNVGILQVGAFPALETARVAFESALSSSPLVAGKTINFTRHDSNLDPATQTAQAKSLVASSDLLFGISTGSSAALKNARDEAGKKQPLLFTAVTDPVSASLMTRLAGHDGSVTGTSDDNPVENQVGLISRLFDNMASVRLGILYTSSEINSEIQADRAAAEAIRQGMLQSNITIATCTDDSDLQQVATSLIADIDVLYIPTDNTIANYADTVRNCLTSSGVLCITGERGILKDCGHITYSVDYSVLGAKAGEMAAEIISGTKKTENIDCWKSVVESEWEKIYSSSNIADAGVTIDLSEFPGFVDVNA